MEGWSSIDWVYWGYLSVGVVYTLSAFLENMTGKKYVKKKRVGEQFQLKASVMSLTCIKPVVPLNKQRRKAEYLNNNAVVDMAVWQSAHSPAHQSSQWGERWCRQQVWLHLKMSCFLNRVWSATAQPVWWMCCRTHVVFLSVMIGLFSSVLSWRADHPSTSAPTERPTDGHVNWCFLDQNQRPHRNLWVLSVAQVFDSMPTGKFEGRGFENEVFFLLLCMSRKKVEMSRMKSSLLVHQIQ